MADLISPELFARVERSLRKRLQSDVKPHLTRCALHARSEDEFMAAAARLIVNSPERERWLASWVMRRQGDAGDSEPVNLDSSVPSGLEAPLQRSFRISTGQRERLRTALARELGPIAEVLIDNESQRADSVRELLQRLETHLEGDAQRERFRQAAIARPDGKA